MKIFRAYIEDTRGHFAMMFALFFTLIAGCAALAIEYSNLSRLNAKLVQVAEVAALTGAIDWDKANREETVKKYILANGHQFYPSIINGEPEINFNDSTREVEVIIRVTKPLGFARMLGRTSADVSGSSVTEYQEFYIEPVSMAFALDVSGSMDNPVGNGEQKVDTLKRSIKSLFTSLEKASEDPQLMRKTLRSGMSAFNTQVVSVEPMNWGWDTLITTTDKLTALGATNTLPALTNSHVQLTDDRVFRKAHDPKYNPTFHREVTVLMTDGKNDTGVGDAILAEKWNEDSIAKCQEMKDEGIEIYSINFDNGAGILVLLECASWNSAEAKQDYIKNYGNKDPKKCFNNGAKGKGKAKGHCVAVDALREAKDEYFYDADDAAAFEAAFMDIGDKVGSAYVRVKS